MTPVPPIFYAVFAGGMLIGLLIQLPRRRLPSTIVQAQKALLSKLDDLTSAWLTDTAWTTLTPATREAVLEVEAAKRNLRNALRSTE